MTTPTLSRIEVACYRLPIERPVLTSFGRMTSRPAVFVRLTDSDGAFGWGEIFANWPAAGAEHRARLLIEDMADLVLGFTPRAPSDLFQHLDRATYVRALQCGEWGPFRQVIAGLDTALHDLFARRAGQPLSRMLGAQNVDSVHAYASGIHVAAAAEVVEDMRARGHRAFKVKVGFEAAQDLEQLSALTADLRPGERLFTDANQAWNAEEAVAFCDATRDLDLGWLEEPILADAPAADWARVARASNAPLAGGENIAGLSAFEAAIAAGHLKIFQPDVAKWGGVTGCLDVARRALTAGATYCPHFLGGGIGLVTSAHLLAAAGGPGLLEIDANPNPLRDAFVPAGQPVTDGRFPLLDAPGLGIEEIPADLTPYRSLQLDRNA